MQPSWRQEGESLMRSVPQGETWQLLRKGGTSGIYVVVVGLSWWIKAQRAQRDAKAWSIVDDIVWVLREMKHDMAPVVIIPQKRAREDCGEDETGILPRKM
jgi:hypothetical protein